MNFSWDKNSFYVDGKPVSLISGEFHYFRVPNPDWRKRLILLKESGANCVATYIPWIVHEPEEGRILFDDIPERSLTEFLALCSELGLMVIVRPGPYSYSELRNDGLPLWLGEKYPQTRSRGPFGEVNEKEFDASYLHPIFLEKARCYVREVNRIIRPFLATNGGCVISSQIDNEIGGKDIWHGVTDCNKEAMGIGTEGGYYVEFLREKYKSIDVLNAHYETFYESFEQVDPFVNTPKNTTLGGKRAEVDYRNFYKQVLERYVRILSRWNEEDGIDVDYCTNAGSPSLISMMRDISAQNERYRFFMGVDHYYALSPHAGISMTPEKTVKYAYSLDMLEALGMPPSVLEMQSGSASCYPPITPDNLYGFYMTHVALGMKGSNYYVFTGGPNFENTGNNTEIYDYHAPVSATGEVRPLYYAQKKRNEYSINNEWLLNISRSYDVQLGFCWETNQDDYSSTVKRFSDSGINPKSYYESLMLTVGLAARLFKCREVADLDPAVPAVVVTDERMPRAKQEALVGFIKNGGRAVITPVLPKYDEDFVPCTVLADYLGVTEVKPVRGSQPIILETGEKVYGVTNKFVHEGFSGQVLGCDAESKDPLIEYKKIGKGEVIVMGTVYAYSQFCQADMLKLCIEKLGGKTRIITDSKNLIVTLFEDGENAVCFLINNLLEKIETDISIDIGTKILTYSTVNIPAMSVVPIVLK